MAVWSQEGPYLEECFEIDSALDITEITSNMLEYVTKQYRENYNDLSLKVYTQLDSIQGLLGQYP